jgi:hypothetical protein
MNYFLTCRKRLLPQAPASYLHSGVTPRPASWLRLSLSGALWLGCSVCCCELKRSSWVGEKRRGAAPFWLPDQRNAVDSLMQKALAAAEKVARYRHAQLSAVRLAGDINARNYDDATLEELVVSIKSELVKLDPHIGLDPNQLLQGVENRSPLTVNGSEPDLGVPLGQFYADETPVPGDRRRSGEIALRAIRRGVIRLAMIRIMLD